MLALVLPDEGHVFLLVDALPRRVEWMGFDRLMLYSLRAVVFGSGCILGQLGCRIDLLGKEGVIQVHDLEAPYSETGGLLLRVVPHTLLLLL